MCKSILFVALLALIVVLIVDQQQQHVHAASLDTPLFRTKINLPAKIPTFSFTSGGELICPLGTNTIVKISSTGEKTKLAGNGLAPPPYFSGEDIPSVLAQMYEPQSAVATSKGELIIADSRNVRIRKVDGKGIISTLAGNGFYVKVSSVKDGQRAFGSPLPCVNQVISVGQEVYFSTYKENCQGSTFWSTDIFKIATDGLIYHVAGDRDGTMTAKDNKASGTKLRTFMYFTISNDGKELFIAETFGNIVRKVDLVNGTTSIIAGTSTGGFYGDKMEAIKAQLNAPTGIAIDSYTGDVYVADSTNNRIRKIDRKTGIITTIAGVDNTVFDKMKGEGFSQDGGCAALSKLENPSFMEFAPNGDLYIVEKSGYSKLSRCPKGSVPNNKTGKCTIAQKTPYEESADSEFDLNEFVDRFVENRKRRTVDNGRLIKSIRKQLKLLKDLE